MATFTIPGNPIAKMRARVKRIGNRVMSYDPQDKLKKTVIYELTRQVREMFDSETKWISLEASKSAYAAFYSVSMEFHIPYPKSSTKGFQRRIDWGLEPATIHLDLDNLAKFYLDCATEILYPDDNFVVEITAKKIYSQNPRTVIHVESMEKITLSDTAEAILQLLSPDEFRDMLEVTHVLSVFSTSFPPETTPLSLEKDPELYQQRLSRAAAFVSYLADNHGATLAKIAKKYPGYHEEFAKVEDCKAALNRNGKPLS